MWPRVDCSVNIEVEPHFVPIPNMFWWLDTFKLPVKCTCHEPSAGSNLFSNHHVSRKVCECCQIYSIQGIFCSLRLCSKGPLKSVLQYGDMDRSLEEYLTDCMRTKKPRAILLQLRDPKKILLHLLHPSTAVSISSYVSSNCLSFHQFSGCWYYEMLINDELILANVLRPCAVVLLCLDGFLWIVYRHLVPFMGVPVWGHGLVCLWTD